MTHAYDKTIISRLGFDDPDKQNPLHDIACQWLARQGTADCIGRKLLCIVQKWWMNKFPEESERIAACGEIAGPTSIRCTSRKLEVPLSKGSGQYKTTVGFLDCVLEYEVTHITTPALIEFYGHSEGEHISPLSIVIEVKSQPVPISSILRQMNLYKEYDVSRYSRCVFTTYKMGMSDAETLSSQGVHVLRFLNNLFDWFHKGDQDRCNEILFPDPRIRQQEPA